MRTTLPTARAQPSAFERLIIPITMEEVWEDFMRKASAALQRNVT